jgi:hypothetical protein
MLHRQYKVRITPHGFELAEKKVAIMNVDVGQLICRASETTSGMRVRWKANAESSFRSSIPCFVAAAGRPPSMSDCAGLDNVHLGMMVTQ